MPSVDGWLLCARCASVVGVVGAVPDADDEYGAGPQDPGDGLREPASFLLHDMLSVVTRSSCHAPEERSHYCHDDSHVDHFIPSDSHDINRSWRGSVSHQVDPDRQKTI